MNFSIPPIMPLAFNLCLLSYLIKTEWLTRSAERFTPFLRETANSRWWCAWQDARRSQKCSYQIYKWARFWRRRENMEKTQRKTQTREARATRKYAISSQNQIAIMTEIAWISFHCSLSYVVKLLRGRWDFHEISPPNPLNPTLLNQRTSANRQKSWVNYLILAQLIILLYLITQFMVSNK